MRPLSALILGVLLLAALGACAPSDPVERVAEARSFYTATLNGFYATPAKSQAPPEPAIDAEAEVDTEEEASADTDELAAEGEDVGGAEATTPPEPALSDLLLDIVVLHDSSLRLDGLTLDVSLVDAGQQEKRHWRWWIETANLPKGSQAQFTRTFEDVDYAEGDGLFVEVRHPVPAEERDEYREFAVEGS